jgi:hypothetical protein
VDIPQLFWRPLFLVTGVCFDVIVEFELFEKPDDTLTARFVEPSCTINVMVQLSPSKGSGCEVTGLGAKL